MKYGILKYLKKVKFDRGDDELASMYETVGKCKLKIMSLFKSNGYSDCEVTATQ